MKTFRDIVCTYLSVVHTDNLFYDGEAEPGPLAIASTSPIEGFED